MTKKQVCLNNETFAYYSGFNGLELKYVEYGIDDYLYCVSGSWNGKPKYHKLKIHYGENFGDYVILHGYKIPLNECIRMGM